MSAPAPWKSAGGDALEGVFNPHPSSLWPAGAIPPATTSIGAPSPVVENYPREYSPIRPENVESPAPWCGAWVEIGR